MAKKMVSTSLRVRAAPKSWSKYTTDIESASESNVLELEGLTVPGFEPVVIGGPLHEQVERFREILERFSGK